jgi:hypothetical protein
LIFAIASKYGQLTDAEWKEGEDDDQMYFSRAKSLSLEDQLMHYPDLQQLQVERLTCFYLTASGHINRYVVDLILPEPYSHFLAEPESCLKVPSEEH